MTRRPACQGTKTAPLISSRWRAIVYISDAGLRSHIHSRSRHYSRVSPECQLTATGPPKRSFTQSLNRRHRVRTKLHNNQFSDDICEAAPRVATQLLRMETQIPRTPFVVDSCNETSSRTLPFHSGPTSLLCQAPQEPSVAGTALQVMPSCNHITLSPSHSPGRQSQARRLVSLLDKLEGPAVGILPHA